MLSETIAGHGDPIDGFSPGPWHLFFLVIAGSALARDGIEILGTVHLALFIFFQFTKVAKNKLELIRITHGLIFSKNFNSLIIAVFSMLFPANVYPTLIARKIFTPISCNEFFCVIFFLKKQALLPRNSIFKSIFLAKNEETKICRKSPKK